MIVRVAFQSVFLSSSTVSVYIASYQPNMVYYLLNQAHVGLRLAHTWFLRIAFVHECLYVCVFACVCPRPQGY